MQVIPKWKKIEGFENEKEKYYGYYIERNNKRADVVRKDWRVWSVYFKRNNKIVPVIHIEKEFREEYKEDHNSIKSARALAMSWIML